MALTELFGVNLCVQRKARNLTEAESAERVGMSTETISKIERGIAAPSFPTIEKLGDVLGVPDVASGVGIVAVPDSERSRVGNRRHAPRMNVGQAGPAGKMLAGAGRLTVAVAAVNLCRS